MSTADDAIWSRHFESGFSEKWSQETISNTKNNLNQVYATNNHKKISTKRDDGKNPLMIKRLKAQGEIGTFRVSEIQRWIQIQGYLGKD